MAPRPASAPRSRRSIKQRQLDCILLDEAQFLTRAQVLSSPRSATSSTYRSSPTASGPISRAIVRRQRRPARARRHPGRAQGDLRMRTQGDDEPARRRGRPRRPRRRPDRDRRQRTLHRPLPPSFHGAAARGRGKAAAADLERADHAMRAALETHAAFEPARRLRLSLRSGELRSWSARFSLLSHSSPPGRWRCPIPVVHVQCPERARSHRGAAGEAHSARAREGARPQRLTVRRRFGKRLRCMAG